MSSVVISGDTSGAITLQAPAVAGSTTLNLPASSGTILTQNSSAPANSFVVDASGNVTIGGVGILGIGQTWTDVTASRALGTTYTNSTGKPIQVMMCFATTSTTSRTQTAIVNGVTIFSQTTNYIAPVLNFIVPSGATYSITSTGLTLGTWSELR